MRFYRGLLPEMIGNIPTRTAMYAGKDWASKFLAGHGYPTTCFRELLAGIFSGLPEAIVTTPFQVVKIRMQNKELVKLYANDLDCLLKVLSQEGPLALFTGLQSTVLRNSIWNGVYFGSICLISQALGPSADSVLGHLQSLATGLGAGLFATCFNAPFYVAKSRIQQSSGPTRTTSQVLLHIAKEEGPRSLYKGFTPKAWRMGVGGAVSFATFEFVRAFGQR